MRNRGRRRFRHAKRWSNNYRIVNVAITSIGAIETSGSVSCACHDESIAMKTLLCLAALASTIVFVQPPERLREWVDPDTGHRIVRLSDAAGGSTLYFHDNAFSPKGDTLMFNTPGGIAIVDVAKIGNSALKPEIVAQGRGGYFARRSREIYFTDASGGREASVHAVNIDTKQVRDIPHAR